MPRTFEVLLEAQSGKLIETVTATDPPIGPNPRVPVNVRRLKRKALKKEYRELMKDRSQYPKTDMADSDHPTLVMSINPPVDEVSFFCFEEFQITVRRDPNVDDDPGDPDTPFTKQVGPAAVLWTFDVGTDQGAVTADRKFRAGPYQVAAGANSQKFWKFSIETKSGLKLDPDIVTE